MALLSWARREPRSVPGGTEATLSATVSQTATAAAPVSASAALAGPTNVTIEAESMTVLPAKAGTVFKDSAASGQKGLLLNANATVSKTLSLTETSTVIIRARGDQYNGAPSMTVSVDGRAISTTQVSSTSWRDYSTPVQVAAGTHTITVAFTNAFAKNASQGRYLRLDKITIVPASTPSTPGGGSGYFQAADWLWKPIPSNPAIAANSTTWVNYLSAPDAKRVANLYQYGVTLIPASAITSTTPRYDVAFSEPWGSDPFGSYSVPIPLGTKVPPGSDGHIAVLDPVTGKAFGIWQAKYDSKTNTWSGSWGGMTALNGNGIDQSGSATATNLARYAGVVTAEEFSAAIAANGGLNHALFVSSDIAGSGFVAPATKSDGTNIAGVATPMPEGYRIQLDPSINVDAIPNITPGEKVIAKTLQTYGAYVGDQGSARLAVMFEAVPDANATNPGAVYTSAGFGWDYYDMKNIPWTQLRVLDSISVV
jgi:Ca-dependent carbohydrate-binding module xylan-binding